MIGRMLGRLLCRLSFHKWEHRSAVDRIETDDETVVVEITDYAWCKREDCHSPNYITNVERRSFTPPA